MNEIGRRWVYFARENLQMAEIAVREGIWNQACFNAQQCVEKMLKAVLADRESPVPRTHSMADLMELIADNRFDDIAADIRALDRFYIATRYPDALPGALPEGLPGSDEAGEALELAKRVASIVEKA